MINVIKCKYCDFTSSTELENANHVKWNHYKEDTSYKFLLKICCIKCKKETTVQSFKAHLKTHEEKTKTGNCLQCNKELFNNNKFCSQSCSATYNNFRKDYTNYKPGPKPGFKPKNAKPKYTKVKRCIICKKFHPRQGLTCGPECKSKYLSIKQRERIDNGWNPQEHRCRSKPSFLEKSFEERLISIEYKDYIKNKTFRCGKKLYFGDFFFPSKNILVELDGKQHENSIEYDTIRDNLIKEYYGVETIRITYKEYMAKSKIDIILQLLK